MHQRVAGTLTNQQSKANKQAYCHKLQLVKAITDDRHLVHTLIPVDGRNDYINAVRVQVGL